MEAKVAVLETRLDHIDKNVERVRTDVEGLRSEFTSLGRWVLGIVLGGVLTFGAIMIAISQIQTSWIQHTISQGQDEMRRGLDQSERRFEDRFSRLERLIEQQAAPARPAPIKK